MGSDNHGYMNRTGITWRSGGLNKLDCSELVYRTLESDGLLRSSGGNTASLLNEFSNTDRWVNDENPAIGDVFLRRDESSGHTGIVTGVSTDENGDITVEITHAKGRRHGTVTESMTLSELQENYSDGWQGFFRPTEEKRPDRIEKKENETRAERAERRSNNLRRASATMQIYRERRDKREKEKERLNNND